MNLKPNEAASRLRISPGTLANWRVARQAGKPIGPRFIKHGRVILYPETELALFEQAHLVSSTSIAESLGANELQ